MSGVLLETGNMSDTIVANIVIVSMIATPETEGTVSRRPFGRGKIQISTEGKYYFWIVYFYLFFK